MKISVKVKANSKQEKIIHTGENAFLVWVKAPALEGKANKAVIEVLSDYFSVPKTQISILQGQKNKNKMINIE